MQTEGPGEIVARALTVAASTILAKRVPSMDGIGDAELVRAYMGCVSGFPVEDKEALPEPLTVEDVARLTDRDVQSFARLYLEHIVKPKEIDANVVAQMAQHIRDERNHHVELMKKAAESMRSALSIGSTSNYMKNWQALTKNVAGPFNSLRDEVDRIMGKFNVLKSSAIGNALRAQAEDRDRMLKAARSAIPDDGSVGSRGGVLRPLPSPPTFRLPEPTPENETPGGRTAMAVEKLGEVSERVEEAMGLVLEHAAAVSTQVGLVVAKIEVEATNSQKAARKAFWLAAISLAVAALGLGVSAYFSHAGYKADRIDAQSNDKAAAALAQRVQEQAAATAQRMDQQTAVLRELLAEARKPPAVLTPSTTKPTPDRSTATGGAAKSGSASRPPASNPDKQGAMKQTGH
jgi:hypothetical protein